MVHAGILSKRIGGVVALTLCVLLSGCSPRYDWRVVSLGDGQVRAMLPDKPHATERKFVFEGHEITFVLTSASVDDVLFTVGYADLPDTLRNDASARERLVRQTQTSLYQNLGATLPASLPTKGERFTIMDQRAAQTEPLHLEAMIWATQYALIEGIVIGKADAMPKNQINEFLRELAPGQRPAQSAAVQAEAS